MLPKKSIGMFEWSIPLEIVQRKTTLPYMNAEIPADNKT
jgi:hypothetical protein